MGNGRQFTEATTLDTPGRRMRLLRTHAGLTQVDVAARIHTTQAAVSQWEHDKRFPGLLSQKLLADLYGVPRSFIFGELVAW